MSIQLSDHFTYGRLLLFTIPSMLMMMLSSVYGMVDGYCVSNYIGKEAVAAVNLIMPFAIICSTVGMMLSSGGSAYIARLLGKKQQKRANGIFSFVVVMATLVGLLGTLVGVAFTPRIAVFMGADESLLPYCVTYGRIFMLSMVPFSLQGIFQVLLVTAERPKLGLVFILLAGITNIVLDVVFLTKLHMGVEGAAWASFISSLLGGLGPLVFFLLPNKSLLRLSRPLWEWKTLLGICWNGSSEMVNSISASVCAILYNLQLMDLLGEDGVAAYGVIMYVDFIFLSLIGGFLMGAESVIGYHYGAENYVELQNLRRRSLHIVAVFSVVMFFSAEFLAPLFADLFVGYDASLTAFSVRAFRLYAFAFLVMGFNGLVSTLFTAIGNGLISAIISFCRTFVFEILSILLLPLLLGIDGVWLTLTVAECCCLFVSFFFYKRYKQRYCY